MPDKELLIAAIESYEDSAHGSYFNEELSHQRSLAIEAYAGKNIEPAPQGRSQVVDRTIFETVQEILPSLTRIFAGGSDVVEFEPFGPEDEEVAKQESDYLNYLVTQKNNWFMTCLTWFQDALITKNAYCLAYMDDKEIPEVERYEGQSAEQVALLLQDDVEIVGQEEVIDEEDLIPITDEMGQPVIDPLTGQPAMQPRITYNVEVKRVKTKKKLKFKVLPPERVRVGQDTPDFTLEEANFFEYYDFVTISELRQMGYDIDDDIADDREIESREDHARDDFLQSDTQYYGDGTESPDPSMREVCCRWIWIRHDYDEDGIAELNHVVMVGHEILEMEDATTIPVASLVPMLNTHRHMGFSIADLVFDLQRIKTAILRAGLDSLYLSTNPRHAVSNEVNINDLLVSRPGGVVRMKQGSSAVPGQGHVMPLPTEFVFPQAQQGLEYVDGITQKRVGVSNLFSGIKAEDMSTNNAHNAIGQLSTMAAQRVEQIARIFANGIERLFRISHELVIKSGHKDDVLRLNGNWVNIDPTQWRAGRDMRVVAPFSAGNKDALVQRLMVHMQIHEKAGVAGAPFVQADDMYELAKLVADATDVPADKIYTDPATIPPKEPPPDHTMIALEIENKKAENEAQDEARQAELDRYKADLDAQVKELQISSNQELQIALAQLKAGQQIDLEKVRAMLKEGVVDEGGKYVTVSDAIAATEQAKSEIFDTLAQTIQQLEALQQTASAPREVVRDEKGNVTGVMINGQFKELQRDQDGKVIGI